MTNQKPRRRFRLWIMFAWIGVFAIAFGLMRLPYVIAHPARSELFTIGLVVFGANIGAPLGSFWGREGLLIGAIAGGVAAFMG